MTNQLLDIEEKPKRLSPPTCTDGHYFYSLRTKKFEVYIFSFNRKENKFVLVRSVKLSCGIGGFTEEHNMSMATDGGLICLALDRKKEVTFKHYSLVTGKMVLEVSVPGFPKILAWCTRPLSNEHVVLFEHDLVVADSVIQLPRWVCGIGPPTGAEGKLVQNALELAMFHGVPFFASSWSEEIAPLLNHFCALGDDSGVRIMAHILLRLMETEKNKNFGTCIQLFADYYSKCAGRPLMQKLCCVLYLACLRDSVGDVKPNVLSLYLETEADDLDFIFVFAKSVRFQDDSLSPKAVDVFIRYCASVWWHYQDEASYMIQEYLRHYVEPRFQRGEFDGVTETLQYVMEQIALVIQLVLRGPISPDRFKQSGLFFVWEYTLTMIRAAKRYWQRLGHKLLPVLQLAMIDQHSDRGNVSEIRDMMNRTLTVFLELMFAIPKPIPLTKFKTARSFYSKFPDLICGFNEELDQLIIDLLDQCYDIHTESDYADVFYQIRQNVLFDKHGDQAMLRALHRNQSYSGKGIVEYLKTGKQDVLVPVHDPGIIDWCMERLYAKKPLMTNDQKIIMAVFLVQLEQIFPGDTALALSIDPKMFYVAQLYFLLPRALLMTYNNILDSSYVMKLPVDMVDYCFKKILALYGRIRNPDAFWAPLTEALVRPAGARSFLPAFANPQTEPAHFREALLWVLPIEAGAKKDFGSYAQELKSYIWGGSYRVVDVIMRGVTFVERCGVKGLEPLFDTLFEVIILFVTRRRIPFVVQKPQTLEPISTFFTVIHYLRVMFNSSSGLFREYLLKYAQNCSDQGAIVVFSILNDSLEAPRKGVEVHFTYDSVHISGVIDNVHYEQLSLSINKTTYSLAKAQDLWCNPQALVDLTLISDFSILANLFVRVTYADEVMNVFYYAALLAFFKKRRCRQTLPKEFRRALVRLHYPKIFHVESFISTFLFYFQMAFIPTAPFSFTEMAESQYVYPSSQVAANCRLTPESKWTKGGLLMTLDDPMSYISCPIHPRCVMKIKLTLLPSEVPKKLPSLMLSVYGTSRCTPCATKTDVFKVNAKREDPVLVIISFRPKRRLVTVAIDWNIVMTTAVSPSIDMLCLLLELQPNVMIEYDYVYSSSIQKAETEPECFTFKESDVKLMSAAGCDIPLPLSDSSIYNSFQLIESCRNLIDNFKFLLVFYSQRKRTISPCFALRLLLSMNPYPTDETLTLSQFPCKNIWMGYGPKFLDFVKSRIDDFTQEQLTDKYIRIAKRYCGQMIRCENNTALFMRSKQTVHLNNSFVFCSSLTMPLQTIGFTSQYVSINSGCMIVPFDASVGTVVEVVIAARHYMALSIAKGHYDFSVVLESFQKIKEELPFTAPLFHRMIEMIRAISPPIPAPLTFPVFSDVSFLIPESNIHSHPEQYLLPRYIDYVVDPHVFHCGMPASFEMNNSGSIYFAIRQTAIMDREMVFEVRESDETVHTMVPNTFLLLKSGEFTVNCTDRAYQNDSVEFIICVKPDVSAVNEALQQWRPHHSHQLLLSVPPERQLTMELFKILPLSTKFSFETAKFVLAILRNQGINSCLARYQNHIISQQQTRTKTGLIRCTKISFAAVEPDNELDSPSSIDYCRKVANVTTVTPERKEYLMKNNLEVHSLVDADSIRVSKIQGANVSQLRVQVSQAIRVISDSNPVEVWLHKLIQKMPNYVLLMFLEFVTGRWGPRALHLSSLDFIYLFYVNTPDTVESHQAQNVLVLGQFASEMEFRKLLLKRLQDYNDHLFEE